MCKICSENSANQKLASFNEQQDPAGLIVDRIKKPISVIYHILVNTTEQERHLTWWEGSGSYRGYKYSWDTVSIARD